MVLRDPRWQLTPRCSCTIRNKVPPQSLNMGRESKGWHKGIFCPSLGVTHHTSFLLIFHWSFVFCCHMAHLLCRTKYNVSQATSSLILCTISSCPFCYFSLYTYNNLTFWEDTRKDRGSKCVLLFPPCPADIAHYSWHSFLLSLDGASESFLTQLAAGFSLQMKLICPSLPREFHWPRGWGRGRGTGSLGSSSAT